MRVPPEVPKLHHICRKGIAVPHFPKDPRQDPVGDTVQAEGQVLGPQISLEASWCLKRVQILHFGDLLVPEPVNVHSGYL